MKTLKNKIFAGAFALATLGIFGDKNANAQDADSLKIKIDTFNIGEISQLIWARGYSNDEWFAFIECRGYEENHYTKRNIHWGNGDRKHEEFEINYNSGLVNYKMYFNNPYYNLAEFKNLTIEQIFQDKEFAERTKKIIYACNSEEKLREIVKELYQERGRILIPQIKQ